MSQRPTIRHHLRPAPSRGRTRAAVAAGAAIALLAGASTAGAAQEFPSRPDLKPTGVEITTKPAADVAPGLNFAAPKAGKDTPGPMIFDDLGHLVFFQPMPKGQEAYDFRAQTYGGQPVLTWWQGKSLRGHGEGEGVIYDQAYQKIATVKAAHGQKMDLHEFHLTPQGTALILAYKPFTQDLRGVKGGKKKGLAMQNVVQEIDVKTGKLLFEWDANEHIAPSESYDVVPKRAGFPYDYIHTNSVDQDTDGNLLVSARATHTIYKIDRKTGKIIWRIGGKKSSFKMGKGSRTAWQHDAVRQADGTITAFDNNADEPAKGKQSRGVQLSVDEGAKTVALARQWQNPKPQLSPSQGNTQLLPNGDVLLGWGGTAHNLTELGVDGKTKFEARYTGSAMESYRAYRLPWSGQPASPPRAAARKSGSSTAVRVSWNGATTVSSWRVVGGPSSSQLAVRATGPRSGFESLLRYAGGDAYVAVDALDAQGNVLARSKAVKVGKDW